MKRFIGSISICILILMLPGSARAAPPTGTISEALATQVREAADKLGKLKDWQKKILDEDVASKPDRFVSGYRAAGGGTVSAEVDSAALKSFLAFHAPASLGLEDTRVLATVRSAAGCAKCAEAVPSVKTRLKDTLERRGFKPIWVGNELTEDNLAEVSKTKKLTGAVVVSLRVGAADIDDDSHGDEKRFETRIHMVVRDSEGKERPFKGKLGLLANDSFESSVTRVLGDLWIAYGAEVAGAAAEGANAEELLISIKGFKDFSHYSKSRNLLLTGLAALGTGEERQFKRGEVQIAFRTEKSADELKVAVMALKLGTASLTEDNRIQLELR